MLLTELHTAAIPELYERFATVVGDAHWKRRVVSIKREIKGNPLLREYLVSENIIPLQFDSLREKVDKFGCIPNWEINNPDHYAAASFAAQVLSFMDSSPKELAQRFLRRVHGAFKNPDDMRGLRLEFAAATHFLRRGSAVSWPEMNGEGTFDLLVSDVGPAGLEIECKSISADKGHKIHKRESLDFFSLLRPHLKSITAGLSTGLSASITIPKRLPASFRDRQMLAKEIAGVIFRGTSAPLLSGGTVRISEFDISELGDISKENSQATRKTIDSITGTNNRHALVIGTHSGGALALAIQSAADDAFMDTVFDTVKNSADRQLTGKRGGMFIVGFQGISSTQLVSIAAQDNDPTKTATALQVSVSKFLNGTNRAQVVGVGFISEDEPTTERPGFTDFRGAAYFFPKRESPFWSEDFSGLFAWQVV